VVGRGNGGVVEIGRGYHNEGRGEGGVVGIGEGGVVGMRRGKIAVTRFDESKLFKIVHIFMV